MHPTLQPVAPVALPAALPIPPEARAVPLDTPKVHHLPSWSGMSDPQRLAFLRRIVLHAGRDPRIATLAVKIMREAGAEPRQYKSQAAVILKWVQRNIYYVNEPGERLQDPLYTLRVGYGDCDDMALVLASLYESLRMPWKFVLSGVMPKTGEKVRYEEGSGAPTPGAMWSHIYLKVGWPPFKPGKWEYAEPTLKSAPLGWDVVSAHGPAAIPEMQYAGSGAVQAGAATAAASSEDHDEFDLFGATFWRQVTKAVTIGVATTVLSSVVLKTFFPSVRENKPRRNYRRERAGRALAVTTYL